jgi:hypothetical protein
MFFLYSAALASSSVLILRERIIDRNYALCRFAGGAIRCPARQLHVPVPDALAR